MDRLKVHGTLLPILLFICQGIKAQEVKIGDKVPEFTNTNVLNYHKPALSLSDFRGKVVLLDFWNTYCTYCIESFPKLDSLQKLFKDDLQIILVNSESKEKTESFFVRHMAIHKPELPMIINDKKLKAAFPSDGQPYVVWIDRLGAIRNFSGGASVSSANIEFLLGGEKLVVRDPTKERHGSAVDETKFEFISYISRCTDSLNVGNGELHEINAGKSATITSNCASIINLFKKAFGEFGKYNFETSYGIELNVKDTSKFIYPNNDELLDSWLDNNAYNYELILPKNKTSIAYKIMQRDLLNYFDLDVKVIKKDVYGVKLEVADSVSSQSLQHQNYLLSYAKNYPDSVVVFDNQTFDEFTNYLNVRFSYFFPYKDETGNKKNISIILRESSITPYNNKQFQEDIACSGLTCAWETIRTDVLVVSEKIK